MDSLFTGRDKGFDVFIFHNAARNIVTTENGKPQNSNEKRKNRSGL